MDAGCEDPKKSQFVRQNDIVEEPEAPNQESHVEVEIEKIPDVPDDPEDPDENKRTMIINEWNNKLFSPSKKHLGNLF